MYFIYLCMPVVFLTWGHREGTHMGEEWLASSLQIIKICGFGTLLCTVGVLAPPLSLEHIFVHTAEPGSFCFSAQSPNSYHHRSFGKTKVKRMTNFQYDGTFEQYFPFTWTQLLDLD